MTTIDRLNGQIPTDPAVWFAIIVSLWLATHLTTEEASAFALLLPAVRELLTPGRR